MAEAELKPIVKKDSHPCPDCAHTFKFPSQLKWHQRMVHQTAKAKPAKAAPSADWRAALRKFNAQARP